MLQSYLFPLLCLSFVFGILAADAGSIGSAAGWKLSFTALSSAIALRRTIHARAVCAIALFAAAGAVSHAMPLELAGRDRPEASFDTNVEADVCGRRDRNSRIELDLCRCVAVADGNPPIPGRIRVAVERQDLSPQLAELGVGQRIRARLRIRPLRDARNPGARDDAQRLARLGIGARAGLVDPALVVRLSRRDAWLASLWSRVSHPWRRARQAWGERLMQRTGRGGGLLRALALGERSGVERADRDAFARLGIAHLLAVSGLHLSLMAGMGYGLALAIGLRLPGVARRIDLRRPCFVIAFCVAGGYGVLAGWGVPVRRAFYFLACLGLAMALGRPLRGAQVLSLAALPLLIVEPRLVFDFGAQLSFAACAALILAKPGPVASGASALLLRTSATAIAATAPILALHGAASGVWGLVANLIAVPWVGFVLLPTSLLALTVAQLPESGIGAGFLDLATALAAWTLDAVSMLVAALPDAERVGPPNALAVVAATSMAGLALTRRHTLARVMWVVALGLSLSLSPRARIQPSPPRLVAFDVGLGDATLIQGRRAAVLIDAGRARGEAFDQGRWIVLPGLAALGVAALDVIIVSHADLDHRGGVPAVLRALPVERLWLPFGAREDPGFAEVLSVARDRSVRVSELGAGDPAREIGDLRITALWPPRDGIARTRNAASLVVRVEVTTSGEPSAAGPGRGISVLLPGDLGVEGEHALIERRADLRADVLKVGHHGSRTSSAADFLRAVSPALSIVSAPCHGRGGLPNREALDRLTQVSTKVWWTGHTGAIMMGLGADRSLLEARGWARERVCEPH